MKKNNKVAFITGITGRARKLLGWKPKTSFKQLIEMMVESDLSLLR